ncbi:hypothetical protein GCM10017687_58470 [Streptomyces echinatus]
MPQAAHFRALDDEQTACACHIHVGLPDPRDAVHVSNHLRPWLPTLIASARTPRSEKGRTRIRELAHHHLGTLARRRPPRIRITRHFDDLVDTLIDAEDSSTAVPVLGHPPLHHLPHHRSRVADAALTPDDTLMLAASYAP